jgi:hypothetical protein
MSLPPALAAVLIVALIAGGSPARGQPESSPSQADRTDARDQERIAQTSRCNLGLISVAGNKFEVTSEGFFASQRTHRHDQVDWNLDALVFSRVQAAARGLAVRNIAYDKDELRRPRKRSELFSSFTSDIRDFARTVSAGTSCDRYVVIHREAYPIATARYSPIGFGITRVQGLGVQDRAYLHALTAIRIYDGKSFELLGEARATTGPAPRIDLKGDWQTYQPVQEIDPAEYPTVPQQGARSVVFRDIIRSLLATSLDRTLPGLLRPAPKPGGT